MDEQDQNEDDNDNNTFFSQPPGIPHQMPLSVPPSLPSDPSRSLPSDPTTLGLMEPVSTSSVPANIDFQKCPFCDKMCKGVRGTKIHISKAHPEQHIQGISRNYQPPQAIETRTVPQDSVAEKEIKHALQECNMELERLLVEERISQEQCDVVVDKIIKILCESKEKLPGPKHPARKYYEARRRRATFRTTNIDGSNFQSSSNPQRSSENQRKRRRDQYNFQLMQHLFFHSRKKAVRMILHSSFDSNNCNIPMNILLPIYQSRWGTSNNEVLPDYGHDVPRDTQREVDSEYNRLITEEEVEKCIKGINLDTSSGLDGVGIKSIKSLQCYRTIALIGSVMHVHNVVPCSFRKARTILIYKKGPANDPNNWRPISICSVLRRIIERVLDKRLNEFIVINENQVGFSSSPGTYINTEILNACLLRAKQERKDCTIVMLDVQRAFDESGHQHIANLLDHTLLPSKLRMLTKTLVVGNSTQIQTKSGISTQIDIKKGFFQGLPLSPKMFNLSINHVLNALSETEIAARYGFILHENVQPVTARGFADDIVLFGDSEASATQLTKIAWAEFDKVGYKLNFDKCIVINIQKGKLLKKDIDIDNSNMIKSIEIGETIKYLGVTFEDEIVFKPEIIMERFNKDLQNLITTQMLYPHQKISIINQYIWPCLIYALQNAPLIKINQAFLDDLDKMIRTTIKSIIGLPHDSPNSMLYAPKMFRGLQILRPSWETFVQHFNICTTLLKCNDKYIPYCKDIEAEMNKCIEELGLNKQQLEEEMQRRKTKPSTIMREHLRKKEYENWCALTQRGMGVEIFKECPTSNHLIVNKDGLTNSEWVTSLKMACNVVPVRSIPGRSSSTPQCRRCNTERETLAHVLGSCHVGDLLRNSRHHEIRKIIAKELRKQGWQVQEEIHCVADDGSNRRVDILCWKGDKGFIIDPTVRTEKSCNQAKEVDEEKKSIYEPCVPYFKENFNIKEIKVIGLLIGARGAMTSFFEEFRKNFNLPKSILKEITTSTVRGSCKIIHNHLYKNNT